MKLVRFLIPLMLVSPAAARSFFFPHYADGNGFTMKLVISNYSASQARGWLSVFDSYGRLSPLPFDVGETGRVELDLAPHATSPSAILMKLFDLNGQLVDAASYDPGGAFQQARFVSQLLKLPPAFQGTLWMRSESPFSPLGLRFGDSVLSSLPLISIETISPSTGTTYYIDSERGSDQSNGTAQDSAWRSLDRVNERIFQVRHPQWFSNAKNGFFRHASG